MFVTGIPCLTPYANCRQCRDFLPMVRMVRVDSGRASEPCHQFYMYVECGRAAGCKGNGDDGDDS